MWLLMSLFVIHPAAACDPSWVVDVKLEPDVCVCVCVCDPLYIIMYS